MDMAAMNRAHAGPMTLDTRTTAGQWAVIGAFIILCVAGGLVLLRRPGAVQ
jgi:hypothetical protein